MKRSILIITILLLANNVHAGIVCRTTCSAKSKEIVNEIARNNLYFDKNYEAFKKDCSTQGGYVVDADPGQDFDRLGCYENQYSGAWDLHFSYCVKDIILTGAGYGITHVRKDMGGTYTASSNADESCKKNVTRYNCSTEIESLDYKRLSIECKEI